MSDHLVNCSLIIPIRPHLQWRQLHCRAQCNLISCGNPPPPALSDKGVSMPLSAVGLGITCTIKQRMLWSADSHPKATQRLFNKSISCEALDFRFCRSCHRRRISLMKPSRVSSDVSPPECSSTSALLISFTQLKISAMHLLSCTLVD